MISHEDHGTGVYGISEEPHVLCADDVAEAARLHVLELEDEFLTRFGERFIARYYLAFVQSRDAAVLGLRDRHDGHLVGVLAGASDARAHFRYLARHHGIPLAIEAVRAMVKDPAFAAEIVRTRLSRYAVGLARAVFRRRSRVGSTTSDEVPQKVGFAVYVAVGRGNRRSGSGRALFRAFEAFCDSAGAGRIEAATRPGSAGEKFFHSIGWTLEEERTSRSNERYLVFARTHRG